MESGQNGAETKDRKENEVPLLQLGLGTKTNHDDPDYDTDVIEKKLRL